MSSPATDPIGEPGPEASPARPKPRAGSAADALGLLFFIGSIFLSPLVFVINLVVLAISTVFALVVARGLLFPVGFRARRKHFWYLLLTYLFGLLVLSTIHVSLDENDISHTTATVLTGILGTAMAASFLAVSVSRLHDRDLSGWWAFFYCGIPAAAISTLAVGHPADWEFAVFGILIAVFVPWAIFALGFRAGTIGPNRFGEESPWYRDTRRRRSRTGPPPLPQSSATAQPAGYPSSVATQAPEAVVSTADVQPAQMPLPAAPADDRGPVRELIGDLVSVKGRMDPGRYRICTLIQCAYALVVWLVIHLVTSDRGISQRAYWISVGAIAFLPAGLSMIASSMRRLHDRDILGWWLPGFFIVSAVILEANFLIFDQEFVMDVPFIGGISVAAIWLVGRTPGTVGPNRFGPDPLD